MDYKLFHKSGLLLLQKGGKFSVFKCSCSDDNVKIHPLGELVNVSNIRIEEKAGLIFSAKGLFTLSGKKVSNFTGTQCNLLKLAGRCCYLIASTGNSFGYDVLLWDGEAIRLDTGTEKYAVSSCYVAVADNENWRIYSRFGEEVKLAYPIAKTDNLFLGDSLAVCGTAGKYRMYSLSNKSLLCDNKNLIVCSPTKPFALCAEMSGQRVDAFYNDGWNKFEDVEKFCILDDELGLFALRKGGKYFIYNYEGILEPEFAEKYPNGVDFVASDNGILLVIDGEIADGTTVNFHEKVTVPSVQKKHRKK